jgi:hypothetical protein
MRSLQEPTTQWQFLSTVAKVRVGVYVVCSHGIHAGNELAYMTN